MKVAHGRQEGAPCRSRLSENIGMEATDGAVGGHSVVEGCEEAASFRVHLSASSGEHCAGRLLLVPTESSRQLRSRLSPAFLIPRRRRLRWWPPSTRRMCLRLRQRRGRASQTYSSEFCQCRGGIGRDWVRRDWGWGEAGDLDGRGGGLGANLCVADRH